jgi:hypothetical protein
VSQALSTKLLLCVVILLWSTGPLAAAQSDSAPPGILRIKPGVKLMLDLDTALNSATARISDVVWFKTRDDVIVSGRVAMPRGTPIRASVVSVKPAVVNGKHQKTEIQMRLEQVPLASGGSLAISADDLKVEGEKFAPSVSSAAQNTLGQATQGALLGASLGRSAKGAAIGAAAAVGVGVLSSVLQHSGPSSDVDLPTGSVFEAKLQRPIDIPDPAMLAKNIPNVPPSSNPDPAATGGSVTAGVIIPPPSDPVRPNDAPNASVPTFDPLSVPEGAPSPDGNSAPAVNDVGTDSVAADVNGGNTSGVLSAGTLKVEVNLVQVDAVVRDRSGRLMDNLRR